jgi:serine/threonine protein kinase/tetratricopeptide (TPR) repeat protein
MSAIPRTDAETSTPLTQQVDQACDRFEDAWKTGRQPRIEDFLDAVPEPGRPEFLHHLLVVELQYRMRGGEQPTPEDYRPRFPGYHRTIEAAFGKVSSAACDLLIGRTLSHYRVVERLGAGGMGVVYRAQDLALGRATALKVLPAGFTASLQARLLREAWASARLQHPGIATFYEAGEVGGVEFIAMEYVPGRTLRDRLREGPLPVEQALALVAGVLEALAHAHAAGILHRDIKPANLMLAEDGSAKLLDFGLAKPLLAEASDASASPPADGAMAPPEGPDAATSLTETVEYRARTVTRPLFGGPGTLTGASTITGSPGYMAPEQIRGEPVDVRTDLFAVGAVLYEAIAGRPAFPGATLAECFSATLNRDPPLLCAPDLPPGLDRVVARALECNASRRYPSAGAFLVELRRVGAGEAVSALPDTLAILDFQVLGDGVDSGVGGGIAEGLVAHLARVPGLSIIPREAVLRARSSIAARDQELGLHLGCRWLLSGGFRRDGTALSVTARLIDVPTGQVVIEERLEGSPGGLIRMLDRLSGTILVGLNLEGPMPETPAQPAPKFEAYQYYAQGRRLWLDTGKKGSSDEAREQFEQAITHDPSYAPALASLAQWHAYRFNFTTEPETLEVAADYARRAIAADPRLAEAHVWLGYVFYHQGKSLECYQEQRQAMELHPTHPVAPYFAAAVLQRATSRGEATGLHQYLTGQPAPDDLHRWRRGEALALYQRAVELDPQYCFPWIGTGWAHLELGHLAQARWCFEQAVQLEPKALIPFPGTAGYLGECLRRMGELSEARRQCLAGLEAAEKTDHMYRDTFRGVYLCSLGRAALQQGDLPAARAAFRQAALHARGRPRARCMGHLIVQALAGAGRAGEGPEPFEEALRFFERRASWDFGWVWGCSDDVTLLELARAARTLGKTEEARHLLERAREAGCTEALDEVMP